MQAIQHILLRQRQIQLVLMTTLFLLPVLLPLSPSLPSSSSSSLSCIGGSSGAESQNDSDVLVHTHENSGNDNNKFLFVSAFGSNSPAHKKIHHTSSKHKNKKKTKKESNGRHVQKRQNDNNDNDSGGGGFSVPLAVTNNCGDTIYPGIQSQSGSGPESTGFKLESGDSRWQWVSNDWQGRVWGRTNCSFGDDGTGDTRNGPVCRSGDCGGFIECQGTGETPVTLAEFTLNAGDDQTYYDISLVDGYNIPLAIVLLPNDNPKFEGFPLNLTNPSCIATGGNVAPADFSPYDDSSQSYLGTDSSSPLPFETELSQDEVLRWCPWNLQVDIPTRPSDGVYRYPDSKLQRPSFNPCNSACAKFRKPEDCCTGQYGSPRNCKPSEYSRAAKEVCPDAYSYAFDDQTSTFIVPSGAGFEIVLCPGGRSTRILETSKQDLIQLTQDRRQLSRDLIETTTDDDADDI